MNTEPRLMDTEARLMDTEARLMDTEPRLVDTEVRFINTESSLPDTKSRLKNIEPRLLDTEARLMDTEARLLDTKFRLIYIEPRFTHTVKLQPARGLDQWECRYSKTCLKWPLKKKTKIGFQDRLLLNAGQKYCRMLQESILQYFWPSLSYHLSLRSLFCLLLSGCLKQGLLYCGKLFQFKLGLVLHMHVHTVEKPYVCRKCEKGLISHSSSLKKHMVKNNSYCLNFKRLLEWSLYLHSDLTEYLSNRICDGETFTEENSVFKKKYICVQQHTGKKRKKVGLMELPLDLQSVLTALFEQQNLWCWNILLKNNRYCLYFNPCHAE